MSIFAPLSKERVMIGLWCNGSTTGFGSVCPGSNPGNPTQVKKMCQKHIFFFCFMYDRFMKRVPLIYQTSIIN